MVEESDPNAIGNEGKSKGKRSRPNRDIPGNFTYTTAFGSVKKALEGITIAERPDKFSGDFLATVLKITGGSARPIPQIFKKMGFLTSDGSPTELYSRFKSESGRSAAALEGLRSAFPEIFRRNDYAHRASRDDVVDLIVQVTGLNKTDPIVKSISGTYESIRNFVDKDQHFTASSEQKSGAHQESSINNDDHRIAPTKLGIAYNINIILPETTNIQVFNAIFTSLKNN